LADDAGLIGAFVGRRPFILQAVYDVSYQVVPCIYCLFLADMKSLFSFTVILTEASIASYGLLSLIRCLISMRVKSVREAEP
jgi:hypothetical protein